MTEGLAWLDSLQGSGIRPGLDRMREMLRVLDHPENACRSIIVAGTNGKGSTSATMASILNASGYLTGLYTSPHLVDIRERWMIGGQPIGEELLQRSIELLRASVADSGITPTYFEALTLIAFIAFREAHCEIMVLEVGMGGRLDATNVVRPIASLITPIGFDHMEFLGSTLRKIAGEKGGVIHRGSIVLTTNDDPLILDVLRARAMKFDARFIVVYGDHQSPLPGPFQGRNVELAVRAAQELRGLLPRINGATIESGVKKTRWRGRLERLRFADKDIWIDGFHNAHAASAIAPFIDRTLERPRLLVFGIMKDKNIDDVAHIIFPLFDCILTTEPYPPRCASAAELAQVAKTMKVAATPVPDVHEAIAQALRLPQRALLIGGSLYLAGAAIEYFDAQRQQRNDQHQG